LIYRVRYTAEARADLLRLYTFLLERDAPTARRALEAIRKAAEMLESFPYTCRKVEPDNAYLRELLVSFGDAGYVALFEIEGEGTVNILAVRHQREDDYH
jgi:plasmid stabilization system protein ParE